MEARWRRSGMEGFIAHINKICGKHVNLFKVKVTNCVRQHAQFQVVSWKEMAENDIKILWLILKDKFNFSDDVYLYVMKQEYNLSIKIVNIIYIVVI
ncbi:hypothetical protein GQ457_09G020860 [Hibiscus cannabinus]